MKKLLFLLPFLFGFTLQGVQPSGVTFGESVNNGDTTPPELSSLTIPADGDTLIMELTEVCNTGSGFDATDLALTHTSTGVTVTALASGNGTDTWTFTLSGTIYDGETVTATWPGTGNGIEDTAGNDLASFSSQAVTNNSTQSGGESNLVLAGDTTDRSAGSDRIQGAANALVYCYPGGTGGYNGTAGTLRYGYLRTGANVSASNIKMVVYTKSGSVWSRLETSTARSFTENSLIEFAFAGTNQIPAGTGNVIIGWIADGYCNVKTSGASYQMTNDTDGTYASPPSAITPDDDCCGEGGLMEIFITNYQR